jgi:hypothetical protein
MRSLQTNVNHSMRTRSDGGEGQRDGLASVDVCDAQF